MTESDRKIILDLYGVVSRNLRKHGLSMRFGSNLLLSSIPDEDGVFDPDDLDGLSCREFLFVCYMRLLGRLPERTFNSFPTPDTPIPPGRDKEYKESVLPSFLLSDEFRLYHGVEDPPRPSPPPPPPFGVRLVRFGRGAIKRITPLFARKIFNSVFRHG